MKLYHVLVRWYFPPAASTSHFLRLEQLHRKPAPATELATRRVERAGGSIRGAGRLRAASAALGHGQRDRSGRVRLKPENGCADEGCCDRSRASRWLCHSARSIAKTSLGHGSEVLQHAIFGGHPVEHAPLSSAKSFPSGPNACAR